MIEYILLILAWYVIGVLSMFWIQCWIDKGLVGERKLYPATKPHGEVGAQEIWVLGMLGPLVTCGILYFTIVIWWVTRNEEERYEKKRK